MTTAGTGAAYTATVEGITELYNGLTLVLIPHVSSSAFIPTLNLNGFGAVQIRRTYSSTTMGSEGGFYQNWLYESVPVLISYDASNPRWIVHTMSKPEAIDLKGIVPASKGGTGKQSLTSGSYLVGNGTAAVQLKTPAQVREDIGAAGKPKTLQISIPASGWDASAKTQTVTATGVTATNAVTPSPAPASWEAAGTAGVRCTAQAADSLTFTCSEVPTADLTYNVLVQEVQ